MLSVKPPTDAKPQEGLSLQVPKSPLRLSTVPQSSTSAVPPSPRFNANEGLDRWFSELKNYEATLGAMARASEDVKFREELGTIEQWFRLLNESEQTASLYSLIQAANPNQIKFMSAVLSQMDNANNAPPAVDTKSKASGKKFPPSLNLPLSPATPQFNTPATASAPEPPAKNGAQPEQDAQEVTIKPSEEKSWANMVSTPFTPMFQKGGANGTSNAAAAANLPNATTVNSPATTMPPNMNGVMNPFNMAMLNNMGFSNEAQLLAMQMVMSGMIQPGAMQGQKMPNQRNYQNKGHGSGSGSWRSPASAKYPGSALRSSGLKSASLKTPSGLRSSGLKSATTPMSAGATPKDEDSIDPQLLEDVPAWLKSLRLHKYTACFEGMTWKDMVVLDEPTLEQKGVAALGARRRLTKTFDLVKRKMGMEGDIPTPTGPPASAVVPPTITIPNVGGPNISGPHSAMPSFN